MNIVTTYANSEIIRRVQMLEDAIRREVVARELYEEHKAHITAELIRLNARLDKQELELNTRLDKQETNRRSDHRLLLTVFLTTLGGIVVQVFTSGLLDRAG